VPLAFPEEVRARMAEFLTDWRAEPAFRRGASLSTAPSAMQRRQAARWSRKPRAGAASRFLRPQIILSARSSGAGTAVPILGRIFLFWDG